MRLLLDEWVARKLKRDLVGHEAATVVEAGYRGMKNGVLLRAASGNYDVLSQLTGICLSSKASGLFKSQCCFYWLMVLLVMI